MSNPHAVTLQFEALLCAYTGAPYATVVTSCTMALRLAFDLWRYQHGRTMVGLPKRTYVSVANEAINAGHVVYWEDYAWSRWYRVNGTPIIDGAHWFEHGMYSAGDITCVSFHSQKPLGIEQGGAILHSDADAQAWYARARFDGRTPGVPVAQDLMDMPVRYRHHCYMSPSVAAIGVQRLYALMHHDKNYPDCSEVNYE
jgi:dTDP-4-amino-4,6-dideoxygalactose transaminase